MIWRLAVGRAWRMPVIWVAGAEPPALVTVTAEAAADPVVHELPGHQRAALEQTRELHLHFHGADPEQVANILRLHEGD